MYLGSRVLVDGDLVQPKLATSIKVVGGGGGGDASAGEGRR